MWSTVQAHAFHFLKEKLQNYGYHTIMELKIQLNMLLQPHFVRHLGYGIIHSLVPANSS